MTHGRDASEVSSCPGYVFFSRSQEALADFNRAIPLDEKNGWSRTHTWPEVGRQILALLPGGYESKKDAKPTRRAASQAALLHVVSANRDNQYLYREL